MSKWDTLEVEQPLHQSENAFTRQRWLKTWITLSQNFLMFQKRETKHDSWRLMKSITALSPLQLVGIDFLHFDPCSGGYKYLLVIRDHFTRFVYAYTITKQQLRSLQRFHDALWYSWEIIEWQRERTWKWVVLATAKTLSHKENSH